MSDMVRIRQKSFAFFVRIKRSILFVHKHISYHSACSNPDYFPSWTPAHCTVLPKLLPDHLLCLLTGPYYNGTGGVHPYNHDVSSSTGISVVKYSSSVMVCDSVNTDCQGLQGSNRTTCLLRQQLSQQLALPDGDPPSITDGGVINSIDGAFIPNHIEAPDPNNPADIPQNDTGNSTGDNSVGPSEANGLGNDALADLESADSSDHEGKRKRRILVLALVLGGERAWRSGSFLAVV